MPKTAPIQIKSRTEIHSDGSYTVWIDVVKPAGLCARSGISTGANKKLAQRLAAAVDAGVAYTKLSIAEDCYKEQYVHGEWQVMGRYLNSDLKRLGF